MQSCMASVDMSSSPRIRCHCCIISQLTPLDACLDCSVAHFGYERGFGESSPWDRFLLGFPRALMPKSDDTSLPWAQQSRNAAPATRRRACNTALDGTGCLKCWTHTLYLVQPHCRKPGTIVRNMRIATSLDPGMRSNGSMNTPIVRILTHIAIITFRGMITNTTTNVVTTAILSTTSKATSMATTTLLLPICETLLCFHILNQRNFSHTFVPT